MDWWLVHLLPDKARVAVLTLLATAVGGLCLFGGIRLVLQGEWLWGIIVTLFALALLILALGGWAVLAAPDPPVSGTDDPDQPADPDSRPID